MGKVSKGTAEEHLGAPGYVGDLAEIEGTTVAFESYSEDSNLSPLFKGRTTTASARTGGRS